MDYLFGTPFELEQGKHMYHFNSDSELLGRFLKLKKKDRVLDIGTNNGVLLCYASLFSPASLTGIDLFPEVIELAEKNLKRNGITAEVTVSSLQTYHHDPFTALICNPPFFTTQNEQLKNENLFIRAARHNDNLSLADLFTHGSRLLETGGTLTMIYPAVDRVLLFREAERYGFLMARMADVYDHPDGDLKRILVEFRKGSVPSVVIESDRFLDRLHDTSQTNGNLPFCD